MVHISIYTILRQLTMFMKTIKTNCHGFLKLGIPGFLRSSIQLLSLRVYTQCACVELRAAGMDVYGSEHLSSVKILFGASEKVPSKGKESVAEDINEKKNVSKESTKSEEAETSEDYGSVNENKTREPSKKTENKGSVFAKDENAAVTDITPAGDARPTESKKKVFKKKPAFEVKQKEEETKDQSVEKEKVIKKKNAENNPGKKQKDPKQKKEKEPRIPKEPKEKKQKKPRPAAEGKDKQAKKPKPPALPVRSLTDEEYEAIFSAAIESAMAINLEEWEPKATSPVVIKKKKYSITVGKKPVPTPELSQTQEPELDNESAETETKTMEDAGSDINVDGNMEKATVTEVNDVMDDDGVDNDDNIDNGHEVDDNNNQIDEAVNEKEVDKNNNNIDEVANVEGNDNDIVNGQEQDNESVDLAQRENEMTPACSVMNYGATPANVSAPACASPPMKKKKISGIRKKKKLEPKSLAFSDREALKTEMEADEKFSCEPERVVEKEKDENLPEQKEKKVKTPSFCKDKHKGGVVREKIKKLKQMRKEHEQPKKNRKVDESLKMDKRKQEKKEAGMTKPKKNLNKKAKMQQRKLTDEGTWVQCCNSECLKWRHLPAISDPAKVPERWVCNMNTREEYNSCDKAEENYDESEHIYTKFTEGSIVWAKVAGFPWWPAMVEIDPDAETYFDANEAHSMIPTHYHVVFFDDKVSRAWVKTNSCRLFTGSEEADSIFQAQTLKRGPFYTKEITAAKKNALKAVSYSLQERIHQFGFATRFHGKWGSDVVHSSSDELKKSTSVEKKRKVTCRGEKKRKQQSHSSSSELLDDDEIESLINNTESFLDNVEEVLDSLDSELDDSDEDSDFGPDEVLPKKKRKYKTSETEVSPDSLKKIKTPPVETDSETELEINIDDKELHNNKETDKSETGGKNDEKNVEISKVAETGEENISSHEADSHKRTDPNNLKQKSGIKFDPEIYSMEMEDDDSEMKESEKSSKTGKKCPNQKAGNDMKKSKIKRTKFKTPTPCENENIVKDPESTVKTETKSNADGVKSKSPERDLSEKTKVRRRDKKKEKTKLKSRHEKGSHENNKKSAVEEGGINKHISELEDDFSKLNEETKKTEIRKKEKKEADSDEEFDLAPEVPDISSQEKETGKKEQVNMNTDQNCEDDFDLIEKSMYDNDPVLEKVQDMEVINVTTTHSADSDSDPFDMMEE